MATRVLERDARFSSPIATRTEVAHLLGMPSPAKLGRWATAPEGGAPLVHTVRGLSSRFTIPLVGIAEAASLNALRIGGMSLQEARRAADFIRAEFDDEFALASPSLVTDGTDAFVDDAAGLTRIRDGQAAFREVLRRHLRPLVIGPDGKIEAFRVAEFTSSEVTIDPRFNAGRMSFRRNRVPVFAVAGALAAGDLVDEVAADFGLTLEEAGEVDRLRSWLAVVT